MRPVDYGRAQLFRERPVTSARQGGGTHLDPLYLSALGRIGNNLNQLMRLLNGLKRPPPPTLEPLLQQIRDLIAKGAAGDR